MKASLHNSDVNDLESFHAAINNGADVEGLDEYGRTPIQYMIVNGFDEQFDILLKIGVNINHRDIYGWTPLHFATKHCRSHAVSELLRHGAEVNVCDEHGNTPLFYAVFNRADTDETVIDMLISAGANQGLKNKHGVSPLDLAVTLGHPEWLPS